MSPRTSVSIQVCTLSTRLFALMYPATLYLFRNVSVTTLNLSPSTVSALAVTSLLAIAVFRKVKGNIQRLDCVFHGAVEKMILTLRLFRSVLNAHHLHTPPIICFQADYNEN